MKITSTGLALLSIGLSSGCQTPTSVRAQGWQPVPLMTAAQRAQTKIGGEGAQVGRAVAVSSDGKNVIWGTDVGGLFRSTNGGTTYEPANVGYTPRGTACVAFDPKNPLRLLSVGANSAAVGDNGLYLSENGAASWRPVINFKIGGHGDAREQIVFDVATYDATAKMTKNVYWSRLSIDPASGAEVHPAFYKSSDGGRTWAELPNTAYLGGAILKAHPSGGVIYAGSSTGFYRSTDGGAAWTKTLDGAITGLDVSKNKNARVWASKADGLFRSLDSGKTWAKLAGSASIERAGSKLKSLHVAPTNALKMVVMRDDGNWQFPRFYSSDGGATWKPSRIDGTMAFLPTNARGGQFAWSPLNSNVVYSEGGDYPTKSTDGGATYKWSGDGVNNILVGSSFNFNAQNPDVLFVGSQDYNGASTLDGGKTWTYQNPSGNSWGGFTYGGYAASPQVLVVGNSSGWGEPREITVTNDGGTTWTKTGKTFQWAETALGAPDDANVVFCGDWRSTDGGASWTKMTGCTRVYTFNARTNELWGVLWNDGTGQGGIVVSTDKGATWRIATRPDKNISDLAVDPSGDKLWAVADNAVWVCEGLSGSSTRSSLGTWRKIETLVADQWGAPRVTSIALDPTNSNIVYIATHRDLISSSAAAQRSSDGGATWTNLTRQTPLDGVAKDGGREAFWVRVHPTTREAWFATACYGLWKIAAP